MYNNEFSVDVREFVPELHMSEIVAWLIEHEAYVPTKAEMPKYGYIAYIDGLPVAAAFLRRVEGGFGQLDGLVTDPLAPGVIRHEAIDAIVNEILKLAKELGIKAITAHSMDKSTLSRSAKHGFAALPHTMIVAAIGKESRH